MNQSVSVVLPVFNGARHIEQALNSALAQTLPPHEIIVVDDGSTDGTEKIVRSYGNKVHYIYQENKGTAGTYNTGIGLASGDYLAFLEQDDLWHVSKLERQAQLIEHNKRYAMVYTPVSILREGDISKARAKVDRTPSNQERTFLDFFARNTVKNCSSVMLRRSVLEEVGGFREDLRLAFDYDLWLRVAHRHVIFVMGQPLTTYRIHESNLSRDDHDLMAAKDTLKVLEGWVNQPLIRDEIGGKIIKQRLISLYRTIAWEYTKQGDDQGVRWALWSTLKVAPYHLPSWGKLVWPWLGCEQRIRLKWYAARIRMLISGQPPV